MAASLAAVVASRARASSASGAALALLAPQQGVSWSASELDDRAARLAAGLRELGYGPGSVCVSALPNVAESLLLQLALARLGATVATAPKDPFGMASLRNRGEVVGGAGDVKWPEEVAPPPAPAISLAGEGPEGSVPWEEVAGAHPPLAGDVAASEGSLLGVFGAAAVRHGDALRWAREAAEVLGTREDDRVCCSVTLMHAFGVGSAVGSALVGGGAAVLPAVGGIRGCGDPKQRADVTAQVLAETRATQLFGDTHTLKALPAVAEGSLALRGGVIKVGSGASFLPGVTETPDGLPLRWAGVDFHAMGKAAA